jgi:hypothetical protein
MNLSVVDTPQLGTNAASQVISATSAGPTAEDLNSAQDVDVLTGSGTFLGVPVGIDITASIVVGIERFTLANPILVYVTRDGSQVGVASFDVFQQVSDTTGVGGPLVDYFMQCTLTVMDTPSAGAHTYGLHLHSVAGTITGSPTAHSITFTNMSIKVREYKK